VRRILAILSFHEVILSLIHFSAYKYLKDIDLETRDRIANYLNQERYGFEGWRQVVTKYGMDQFKMKFLENDPVAGEKTLDYLHAINPDLTVYDFCKTLKEHSIGHLYFLNELRGHLSVPSSCDEYV